MYYELKISCNCFIDSGSVQNRTDVLLHTFFCLKLCVQLCPRMLSIYETSCL